MRISGERERVHGFTLIELLVLVGIAAILVAVIVPYLMMTRESARRTECHSHLFQIGAAILVDGGGYAHNESVAALHLGDFGCNVQTAGFQTRRADFSGPVFTTTQAGNALGVDVEADGAREFLGESHGHRQPNIPQADNGNLPTHR